MDRAGTPICPRPVTRLSGQERAFWASLRSARGPADIVGLRIDSGLRRARRGRPLLAISRLTPLLEGGRNRAHYDTGGWEQSTASQADTVVRLYEQEPGEPSERLTLMLPLALSHVSMPMPAALLGFESQ